jgi:hypothetical protein
MAHYVAKRVSEDFAIDGDVRKAPWSSALWSGAFVDMASGERPRLETRSAILWSDERLYVAFWAEEPQVEAEITQRDDLIFLENDLELFIDGGDCYYEFEINALGTIYEVFFIWRDSFPNAEKFPVQIFNPLSPDAFTFAGDYDRSGASFWRGTHPRGVRWAFRGFDMPGLDSAVKVYGAINDGSVRDEGWGVEISIPWGSLKPLANGRSLPPISGDIWKFFLGRFQKEFKDGVEVAPHPASSLTSHGVYDTHQPEKWAEIEFEDS